MYKTILTLLINFTLFLSLFSQNQGPVEKVILDIDYSRYQYDNESSYVEFYYSILPNINRMQLTDFDTLKVDFNLYDNQDKSLKATTQFNVDLTKYKNNSILPYRAIQGLIKCVLDEGNYKAELVLANYRDELGENKIEREFNLKTFKNDKITLSDIELAKSIKKSQDKTSDYYKNTLEVIPNPTSKIGDKQNRLGYYVEAYNVNTLSPESKIEVSVMLVDIDGKIKAEKVYEKEKFSSSLVEIGFLNITSTTSGYYTLIFTVTDLGENYSIYRKKLIYISHPTQDKKLYVIDDEKLFMGSEYVDMPEDMLSEKLNQALYFASEQEKYIANRMTTLEAKRKWLFGFWFQKAKSDPGLKEKVDERVQFANTTFSYSGKPGWKTDRGRVYIVYGKPDERERNPSSQDTNPFEIWKYYEIQGGVEFDFIDETGFGDYKLVNSTHRDEISDPNWKNYFY